MTYSYTYEQMQFLERKRQADAYQREMEEKYSHAKYPESEMKDVTPVPLQITQQEVTES